MGVTFLEHLGGHIVYRCDHCNTYLANLTLRTSTRFTCAQGPAWLFEKVANVYHDEPVLRTMVTGRHIIRNVYCKVCSERIGRYYEMAFDSTQKYKEGQTILEVHAMREEREDVASIPFGRHLAENCLNYVSVNLEGNDLDQSETP